MYKHAVCVSTCFCSVQQTRCTHLDISSKITAFLGPVKVNENNNVFFFLNVNVLQLSLSSETQIVI